MYYILKDKEPEQAPMDVWVRWIIYSENKTVQLTKIQDVKVSTVFLGIDHAFGYGNPILFETMIFGGKHDQYQERYSTWDEAVNGHHKACKLVVS